MLPGKKRKIAIAIGSLVGASAIIAGVTIPIVLKNKNDDTSKIDLSDFKKLEIKFDKIEKQLNIKQTSDFNLSTSSGQKIIKDHIFSLISFTKKEKEAIFLITKKGIITSKNRLEVVFEIKIDDQKKEYQFQVRHFSSDDEFKLYDLKQKINRYDLEEVIVIDQTKTFNQNLIKQTIIDEINKVNTKKLSTEEKNALSLNNNISLSGIEEKNVVVIITFGKEIAAYTFIISLQEPTDESNFLKLKNKFDSINLEQTLPQILDINLAIDYKKDIVKNFIFSLKNFTKKEKAAIFIITKTGIINKNNTTNVIIKISIGNKNENSKQYTFKLKTSLDINKANLNNLKNKFNKIDFNQAITLSLFQSINLSIENDKKILLNKIIDYINNLNENNYLTQAEKNALSIETKSGFLSHNKISNISIKITFGSESDLFIIKILKLKNQDESNFNSLKVKFDNFKKYNSKKNNPQLDSPILWKEDYDNYLFKEKFYDVLFQSIDEQNPNNSIKANEKRGIKIDFQSRGDDDGDNDFRFIYPNINNIYQFNVDISFGKLKKTYRLRIKRKPFTKPIDQKGIDKLTRKIDKVLDSSKSEARKKGIEIDVPNDIDLNNDSNHNYLYEQIINSINKRNPGNELTKKERNSIINTFRLSNRKINFYDKTEVFVFFSQSNFYSNRFRDNFLVYLNRKKNKQILFNTIKNKFDQATNKEIILKNESQDLLLSDAKIKVAVIDKINASNPDNLIKNKEKIYIIIKDDPSSSINYNDWTNVIVEVKVDSFKKEYTFKIKREKHNEEKFNDLKIKIESLENDVIIIKSNFLLDIYSEKVPPNQRIKPIFFQEINDKLSKKSPSIQNLNQEERNAIKFLSHTKIKEVSGTHINSFTSGEEINLKIGISFDDYYDAFILKLKNVAKS